MNNQNNPLPSSFKTPVLFLVFRRLETACRVFEAIRQAKPPRLYVASDGPREGVAGEKEKVQSVRDYVLENIDWDCEVKTLFRGKNLGCKYAVSGAITWFFESEEQGIILEDDCLPSQSFFRFCEELLERYKDDERIFIISGYNKQKHWEKENNDYFFSNFGGIWGWASWRRAWKHFDIEMSDFFEFAKGGCFESLLGTKTGKHRRETLQKVLETKLDTWAYPWGYSRHKNSGMACVPAKSLIENIGFGDDATHTFGTDCGLVNREEINFPLKDNKFVVADRGYDRIFIGGTYFTGRVIGWIKRKIKRIIGR